jgi:hypothetical protein
MSRRKGELSKHAIDTRWPHQVALRADRCTGGNHRTIEAYPRPCSSKAANASVGSSER